MDQHKVLTLTENQASEVQSRISHAVVRSTPPPTQAAWMAAITGFWHYMGERGREGEREGGREGGKVGGREGGKEIACEHVMFAHNPTPYQCYDANWTQITKHSIHTTTNSSKCFKWKMHS